SRAIPTVHALFGRVRFSAPFLYDRNVPRRSFYLPPPSLPRSKLENGIRNYKQRSTPQDDPTKRITHPVTVNGKVNEYEETLGSDVGQNHFPRRHHSPPKKV
ncbi:MAG: hypothetical protein ACRC6I_09230, partial [Paracoccaceae bacterium]